MRPFEVPAPTDLTTLEAIVLAGGLGTRLHGHIGDLPKPMANVAGRPFLEWQLEALERRGIRRVILSVGHRRESIESHFGDSHGQLRIEYSRESSPLGTGGAIVAAMRLVSESAAFVLNGDTYVRAPLRELEHRKECELSVLVARVHDAERFGTVVMAGGRIVGFREKGVRGPGFVNCGVYWIRKAALEGLERGEKFSFEKDYLERRVESINICAVATDETFVDIGIPESLASAGELIPRLAALDELPTPTSR